MTFAVLRKGKNNEYAKMFNLQAMEKRILVYRMQL